MSVKSDGKDDAMTKKVVTPSVEMKVMTEGQITKAVSNYRAMLEKHALEFNLEAVQVVLGQPELASETFAVFRKRVEMVSNMIVRHVKVDRSLKPKDALIATRRNLYVDDDVVKAMPKGEGEEDDVIFFKPEPWEYTKPGWMSDDDLEKCFERRNLKPTDPYSLAKVHQDDPAFADDKPNLTHWKDKDGNWCFATFRRWGDGRDVDVHRGDNGWDGGWWFAGRRK
jgi:hypothetical protein